MKGFLRFFKKNRNQFLLGNSPSPVDFGVLKHIDALVCRPSNLVVLLNYVLTYYISKHKDSTYRASISSSIDRLRQTSLFGFWGENLTESNFRLNKSPVESVKKTSIRIHNFHVFMFMFCAMIRSKPTS